VNRIKMLSIKVLQDHKEKFGVDFAKNKHGTE